MTSNTQSQTSEPQIFSTLSAQDLQAAVVREDGDVCLLVHDGDTGFEISTAIGGIEPAISGLLRIAATATALVIELRQK